MSSLKQRDRSVFPCPVTPKYVVELGRMENCAPEAATSQGKNDFTSELKHRPQMISCYLSCVMQISLSAFLVFCFLYWGSNLALARQVLAAELNPQLSLRFLSSAYRRDDLRPAT